MLVKEKMYCMLSVEDNIDRKDGLRGGNGV